MRIRSRAESFSIFVFLVIFMRIILYNIVEFVTQCLLNTMKCLLLLNEISRSFIIIELSNRISHFTIDLYRFIREIVNKYCSFLIFDPIESHLIEISSFSSSFFKFALKFICYVRYREAFTLITTKMLKARLWKQANVNNTSTVAVNNICK